MTTQEMVEYEMITRNEVESIKNRLLREDEHFDQNNKNYKSNNKIENYSNNNNNNNNNSVSQYQQNQPLIPTHTPKEGIEEQTNAIPHIPNYWIPVKSKSLGKFLIFSLFLFLFLSFFLSTFFLPSFLSAFLSFFYLSFYLHFKLKALNILPHKCWKSFLGIFQGLIYLDFS